MPYRTDALSGDPGHAPSGDAGDAPSGDAGDAPSGDAGDAPSGDACETRTPSELAWDGVRALLHGSDMSQRLGRLQRETGLPPGTIKMLQRLYRRDFLSMRDIARGLGCDPSYVTAVVDELAEHGLVTRRSSSGDRRVKTVVLTPKGVRVAETVERTLGVPPAAFAALSDEEAQQLAGLLAKVTDEAQ